ncbi:LysR family transcriptional regulator [Duganella violaceipulchra]|uniref:DNA-binding transcriptional LysR family regulator n=1 Tax=Duganella violaceipulchra TaxID=2849652 RepID=A0AA41HC62_9BURK|nr:LysR family transcriptional regulator [Duganella violaceicalia]MBV6323866.1 LysR family transcriptional regulator [Duganella violaceicalia]MCP2007558.1 DNA-binding transcriptional LysR family regulator [Duganella violaceicalia]
MDKLSAMAIFVAVVDEGGFAAAARKLKISPPVVTRAVTELEEGMGVRLLLRTTRVVRLTETGARYAADCRRILADVAETETSAAGAHGAPRGRLVITASVMFGAMYVTPIVTEYLRRYPETDVECRFLDRVVNMMDEGVDAAIRIGALPDSSYQAVRVGQVRQVVCAAPAYLAERGVPATPQALAGHDLIAATAVTATNDWRFEYDGKPQTVKVHPRLRSTSNDAALRAALDGFGITRVLSYMAAPYLANGRLSTILSSYEAAAVPVSVVHHEGRHSSRKLRAFLDLAIATLREDGALR